MKRVIVLKLPNGREPFQEWLRRLERKDRASIRVFIDRFALGGTVKNVKHVGKKVFELKINRGPGFRVYFGLIEEDLVLLLLGGNKSTQNEDIQKAKEYWRLYVSK